MTVVVVYESVHGNTHRIAESIGAGPDEAGRRWRWPLSRQRWAEGWDRKKFSWWEQPPAGTVWAGHPPEIQRCMIPRPRSGARPLDHGSRSAAVVGRPGFQRDPGCCLRHPCQGPSRAHRAGESESSPRLFNTTVSRC